MRDIDTNNGTQWPNCTAGGVVAQVHEGARRFRHLLHVQQMYVAFKMVHRSPYRKQLPAA